MNKYLWEFKWNCGRSGTVSGLFVATEKEVENLHGKDVNFGEILGKHSEVHGTIEEGEITKVDVSSEAVAEVSKVLGDTWSGYNPLHFLQCSNCGCSYGEVEMNDDGELKCTYCS